MKNQISRRAFLRGSLLVTGGLLAACAAPATSEPAPAASSGGEAAPAAGAAPAAEDILLRWDTFRGIGTGWNEERIDTFKEMHPNVTIELRPIVGTAQQDSYAKMYAAFAADDLGEIIAFDPSHFQFWRAIDKNVIMPIDDLIAASDIDLSEWYANFMSLQSYQGKQYGLPSWGWAGFDTLVTNAAHFKAEGIELPDVNARDTSMDTIAEWAHRFYVENERYGLSIGHGESSVVTLTRAFGGDLINADGTQSMLLEDKSVEALRWAYKLAVEDKVLPAVGAIENVASAQVEGKVTMNWGGSLNVRNYDRDIKAAGVDPSVAEVWQILLPTLPDGRFPSQLRGGTWNIRQASEHADVAYEFIRHIAGKEGSVGFNLVGGNFAAVRPDVVAELIVDNPIHEWFLSSLENGIPAHAPVNSRGREFTDAVAQYTDLLLDPNQPVDFEEGLQNLHDNVQAVLDMDAA
ncbi:MAG: extracellular solute-binding protein [Caldilineaceae bacterium]|nr:extracellular solute-binding protein [Caldilineaceae bacterium]